MAGPPSVWTTYAVAVATSDVVNRNTNLNITIRSNSGAAAIVAALIAKQGDISAGPRDGTMAQAYYSFGDFEDKPPAKDLRVVIAYMELNFTFVVPASSDIRSIADLKGKTVPRFTAMPNWGNDLLEAYGLDLENDINWVDLPSDEQAMEEMRLGRVDTFYGNLRGSDLLELTEAIGNLRPLPIDPDKWALIQESTPLRTKGTVIKNIEPGWQPYLDVTAPVPVEAAPMVIGTRADVSADIIYTYTKAWLDNISEIQKAQDVLKDFGPEQIKTASAIPYHEGAIKALKEADLWTDEMEAAHQLALKS